MVEGIASKFLAGIIMVAALTTIFGRSNSAAVFNAIGGAGGNLVSSALGKDANIR